MVAAAEIALCRRGIAVTDSDSLETKAGIEVNGRPHHRRSSISHSAETPWLNQAGSPLVLPQLIKVVQRCQQLSLRRRSYSSHRLRRATHPQAPSCQRPRSAVR